MDLSKVKSKTPEAEVLDSVALAISQAEKEVMKALPDMQHTDIQFYMLHILLSHFKAHTPDGQFNEFLAGIYTNFKHDIKGN